MGQKWKPVRKYDEEKKGRDGGDEEESPEKPTVNSLCKHFPLSSDVVVPRLNNHSVANSNISLFQVECILLRTTVSSSFSISCLQVFLFQEALHHPHQIVLLSLNMFSFWSVYF